MSLKMRSLLVLATTVVGSFMFANVALASAVPSNISCDLPNGEKGIKTSIQIVGDRCVPAGSTFLDNPIIGLLTAVLALFAGAVGLVVTGGVVYGGFLYMTARGNSSQTQQAITVIINACIGLLLFIFMFALLNFIIPGGILV
jgi:hypothetical protein